MSTTVRKRKSRAKCKTCGSTENLINPMTNNRGNMCESCFQNVLQEFRIQLDQDFIPTHSEDKFMFVCEQQHKGETSRGNLRRAKYNNNGACLQCGNLKQSETKTVGYIYLAVDRHTLKIGMTCNLPKRYKDMKVNRLDIVDVLMFSDIDKMYNIEKQIHKWLDKQLLRPNKPRHLSQGGTYETISKKKLYSMYGKNNYGVSWFINKIERDI